MDKDKEAQEPEKARKRKAPKEDLTAAKKWKKELDRSKSTEVMRVS